MDDKKFLELAERMLAQPKSVEVDGQRVENQSVGDLIKAANYFASRAATSGRRSPLRFSRMAAGGALE